jgi:hypothetical protein
MPKFSRKQLYGIVAVTVVVVSSLVAYAFFNQPEDGFKAAIVDQLSLTYENQTFTKTANETLTAAGYKVTYYKGEKVTVDFFRALPTHGYKIILLRVHSALRQNNGELVEPLDFFTSEPYSDEYPYEQSNGWLDIAMYQQGGEEYFGILHGFVGHAMQGDFRGAVIILMGCNGLDRYGRSQAMVQTLVGKGAKVCIGWDETVGAPHTDIATARLLHYLLIANKTIKDAVNATMNEPEIGTNPKLKYYPKTAEIDNYVIPHGPKSAAAVGGEYTPLNAVSIFALPLLHLQGNSMSFGRFRRRNSL